jgi:hypothetical protein
MDESIIKDLADVQQRTHSNTRRIEVLEKGQADLNQLVTSVALIAQKQEQMEHGIDEIRGDVRTLLQKPARRWESIVEIVFKVVLTALITTALIKLGIGG